MNAKIAYYAIPNPTDTASEAPALPRVIPNGVANTNDVIADIKAGIAASEARCRIALDAVIAVALEHVRRGETVDLGGFRLRARIPGSMPCVDTPFDFGENTLVVDVLAEPELNEALAGLVPFKVDASELASMIKVSNVTDVATMSIGEIHGTDEFIITGNGVTLDATGESAKLTDRKTGAELATAEVVTVSKGQRATCKFNPVAGGIAAGSYWLVVTTFGLIGETTPRVFRKPVTLVEAVPAPPGPQFSGDITSTDREGHSVPGKFDPIDHQGVAIPGERLTRDGATQLVLEVRRGGEVAYSKDLTDSLDETLDPDGLQVYFTGGTLYELMQEDGDNLTNGDIVTATFTNALGSTTATGEVYNLP